MKLFVIFFAFLIEINASLSQNKLRYIVRHLDTDLNNVKTDLNLPPYASKLTDDVLGDLLKPAGGILKPAGGILKPAGGILKHSFPTATNHSPCTCIGLNCGCCAHLYAPKIKLNDTVCANISILPAPQYGLSITLTVDNKTLYNKTISVQNPPPLCVAVPYLEKLASLCIVFEKLQWSNKTLSGCLKIEAKLAFEIVGKLDLGCFKIPPGNQTIAGDLHADLLQMLAKGKTSGGYSTGHRNGISKDTKLYFKRLNRN